MLNFDVERFVRIQSGAVGLADELHQTVADALAAGTENLFFLGAGGVTLLTHPAARLLQTGSTFPVHVEMAAELVVRDNVHLGANSLVVMPSLSGTTKEAIEALEFCRAKGAKVVTLTGHAETPMAELADVNFTNFVEDDTSSESYYLQTLLIALSVMHLRGEYDGWTETVAALRALPEQLVEVKRAFEPRAAEIAETIKDEPYHIITGAGSVWPEAYYYGMCILEEMQWIRTRPVHASDFFHGTLELVEAGVSVIVCKGEDETRPLAERVEKFVPDHTEKVLVLDTADFDLPGVPAQLRALLSPVLLATAFERLSAHLEVLRDHPLTTRRYYRRLDY
ncbi:SIS domain-containing protein [Kineococcus sp. SYSU DK003]|uniref:SIS domain-containing protein n=1 Tax=Kineococcus sp. SYSU DK003 TaxID=3383124 RepID=UPI003D7EA057